MVALYKLWSSFSKGLRYNTSMKHKPILVPQIGVWVEAKPEPHQESDEEISIQFHPAVELQNAIGAAFRPA